mmetsp:Transcript_1703/g.2335  ORF Transcript_1703/g.2335 Transcript_1703/m.2335 type:complete len:470 (-) Transcript_1703:223-1632(-)
MIATRRLIQQMMTFAVGALLYLANFNILLRKHIHDIDSGREMRLPTSGLANCSKQNVTHLPPGEITSPSLETLLEAAAVVTSVWDKDVDSKAEVERCKRYGFNYDGRIKRRRIFYGSLIADDSWHILNIAAMEAYGIYDTVALVESDKTQMQISRDIRFSPGSQRLKLLQNSMWGPSARVSVDYYHDDPRKKGKGRKAEGLLRENLQRDIIMERWQQNNMTAGDIGLISDIDEVPTRDFLRSLQVCDVPEFRQGQDCKQPKILCSTLVFEGSPECISKGRRWHHPDFILGECVEGIGDKQKHKPVKRKMSFGTYVRPSSWENTSMTMFPLWDATDFRMGNGGRIVSGNDGLHTAFHFHNFFDSLSILRKKYKTYGHPVHDALEKPLGLIEEDVDFMVDCLMNRTEDGNKFVRVRGGWRVLGKDGTPIAFQKAPDYPNLRHQELQEMMVEDESLHPRANLTLSIKNGTVL